MRKVKIKVPDSLSEIRLSQYKKFLRVTDGVEDQAKINKRMVAVFCDLTDSIVNNMTKKSFDETLIHLSKLLDIDKEMEFKRVFRFQGNQYGFIPNMDDMTVGELADLDSYIVDWQKMDSAMGVLFRPIENKVRDKYTIEEYKSGVKLDLPLDIVLGAYFFLGSLLNDLLSCIPSSIKSIVNQDPKSKTLVENGVGINQFMESLEATCSGLKMSLN